MIKYIYMVLIICTVHVCGHNFPQEVLMRYPHGMPLITQSFAASMQYTKYKWIIERENTYNEVGVSGEWLYQFLQSQWDKYSYKHISNCSHLRIPKIIHQIWIGDGVPEELYDFHKSWQLMHPDWTCYLWTQNNINELPLINRQYIDRAENPAEKSDILRYELLYIYGGVYIDMDCEPLAPLDLLHYAYDFYVGICPLDTGLVQIGSAIIGATPHHPIMKACIDEIPKNYNNPLLKNNITGKTGPILLTKKFIEHAEKTGLKDCAFPATYFYPMGAVENYYAPDIWQSWGAFSVHHWAKTWNKPECRRARFKNIQSWGKLL